MDSLGSRSSETNLAAKITFQGADQTPNEIYHKVLTKLTPADAAALRSDEVAWIKKRDRVTDEFAKLGTPPHPRLRRVQSIVDLTEARSAQLKTQMEESNAAQ